MSEKAPLPSENYPPAGNAANQHMYPNIPPSYDQSGGFIPGQDPNVTTQQPQTTSVIVGNPQVGPNQCSITCPSCRNNIVTRLNHETSTKTHIAAGLLCACGCCLCAWIPYIMDSCKNTNHYCPNCGAFIGTYAT